MTTFRNSLVIPFIVFSLITGCSSSSSDNNSATGGDTTGGDTTGGDTTGGDTTGGDTTGGDTTGGDTTGGDTTGGDTGNDSISGNVQFLGLLSIIEDTSDNEVSAGGTFIRYTSSIAGNLFTNAFTPVLDQCEVETVDISDPSNIPDIETDVVPELVSAGEVIPFTSSAGSFLQLMRQSLFGFLLYAPDPESVPGPMPTGVTANIPGDVFPAFANVAMPTVSTLSVSSPAAGEIVVPGTTFNWTAGTNADAYISITTSAISQTGQVTVVDCEAADDGAFAFPASVQAEMGANFMGLTTSIERQVMTIRQQGNAVLILSANSGD